MIHDDLELFLWMISELFCIVLSVVITAVIIGDRNISMKYVKTITALNPRKILPWAFVGGALFPYLVMMLAKIGYWMFM